MLPLEKIVHVQFWDQKKILSLKNDMLLFYLKELFFFWGGAFVSRKRITSDHHKFCIYKFRVRIFEKQENELASFVVFSQ